MSWRVTVKSNDRRSDLFSGQTSKQYSSIGRHFNAFLALQSTFLLLKCILAHRKQATIQIYGGGFDSHCSSSTLEDKVISVPRPKLWRGTCPPVPNGLMLKSIANPNPTLYKIGKRRKLRNVLREHVILRKVE